MRIFVAAVAFLLCLPVAIRAADSYPLRDAVEFHPRGGIPNVLAKLNDGKEVHIGYLGGSITAAPGWRVKTLKWFQDQYPKAKVSEINAAIGGTGSDLGVYRVDYDALRHKPDLLFIEFAVNDGGADPKQIHRAMEGIVRQAWKSDPAMDICFVYTLTEAMVAEIQAGKFPRAASAMEEIADYYAIPSIHMGVEVAKMAKDGKLIFKAPEPKIDEEKKALGDKMVFSSDGVHPLVATGHEVYLKVVARCIEAMKTIGKPGPHELKAPFLADNYETAHMLPLDKAKLSAGWEKLDPTKNGEAKAFSSRMPSLFKASKAGETLTFKFKGTAANIYDLLGPDCGQLKVSIDGGAPKIVARIDGYCVYHRIALLTIASGLENKEHTVSIELDSAKPDKMKILFPQNRADMEKNPAKYAGNNWYAGGIMLMGNIVE